MPFRISKAERFRDHIVAIWFLTKRKKGNHTTIIEGVKRHSILVVGKHLEELLG